MKNPGCVLVSWMNVLLFVRRGSCRLWRNTAWTGRLGLGNWGLRVCTRGWRWGLGLGSHCGSGWFEPHLRSDEIGGLLCRLAIGATVPAVWFVGVVVRREVAVVAKPGDWYDFSTSNFQGGWFGALSLAVGQLLCSQQSEPILEM